MSAPGRSSRQHLDPSRATNCTQSDHDILYIRLALFGHQGVLPGRQAGLLQSPLSHPRSSPVDLGLSRQQSGVPVSNPASIVMGPFQPLPQRPPTNVTTPSGRQSTLCGATTGRCQAGRRCAKPIPGSMMIPCVAPQAVAGITALRYKEWCSLCLTDKTAALTSSAALMMK